MGVIKPCFCDAKYVNIIAFRIENLSHLFCFIIQALHIRRVEKSYGRQGSIERKRFTRGSMSIVTWMMETRMSDLI